MKFISNLGSLLTELSLAQDVISARNTVSIFSSILIKASGDDNTLTIRSSDMQISFSSTIAARVEQSGEVLVFCGRLISLLRSLKGNDVLFELKGNTLLVKPQETRLRIEINTLAAKDFPDMPETEEKNYFEIQQYQFLRMVQNSIFAVSHDETRFFLNGVYFSHQGSETSMVATDAKRLSLYRCQDIKAHDFTGVIIPPKILNLVNRLSNSEGMLNLAITPRHIFININNHMLSSTLIEGKYPNYKRIIPEQSASSMELDRDLFYEAVRRMAIMSEKDNRCIKLHIEKNLMRISSDASEHGHTEEEIECLYQGDTLEISVTNNSLMEPLRAMMSGSTVVIEVNTNSDPVVLKSKEEKNSLHLFMPVQPEA